MKASLAFSAKKFASLLIVCMMVLACNKKSDQQHPALRMQHPAATKADTTHSNAKKRMVADTLKEPQIASDSLKTMDSTSNHLQETTRKLDIRYFKKSFNLHKKAFITFETNHGLRRKAGRDLVG